MSTVLSVLGGALLCLAVYNPDRPGVSLLRSWALFFGVLLAIRTFGQ